MLDSNNFLEIIKRAAVEADEQAQPCDFLFGTVVSESPLKIRVEQKMELGEAQLILTRNVSDHKVRIKGRNVQSYYFKRDPNNWEDLHDLNDSDDSDEIEGLTHTHALGEIVIKIENALKTGEQVILIKQRGGQKYLVLDRRADV